MQAQSGTSWRGVFAILCTPFHDGGALDLASLEREVEFCVAGGAHGLVTTVNASESWTLSDAERRSVVETTAKTLGGATPLVVGVTAGSAQTSIELARHAEQSGADAVMAIPPASRMGAETDIFGYFSALAGSITIPIFIQNHEPPLGTRMSAELVSRMVNEIPGVDWIKEESNPSGQMIRREIDLCGDKLSGVMSGLAGRYMLDDFRRGACGTMPACESVDVHVQVWNLLDAGREEEARALFERLLPLLNFEFASAGVYKTVLEWRGVIESRFMRNAVNGNGLNDDDGVELRTIINRMSDLFKGYPAEAATSLIGAARANR
jgi:dihydrodipicolinate synthase/N-acetylneuraminate lyase